MTDDLFHDPRVAPILDVFAAEAQVARDKLTPHARAEDLGIGSLDLALAMFAIEDRFGIELPEPLPGTWPTVGELVAQVLARLDQAEAKAEAADAVPPTAAPLPAASS